MSDIINIDIEKRHLFKLLESCKSKHTSRTVTWCPTCEHFEDCEKLRRLFGLPEG